MKIIQTPIKDLLLFEPKVYADRRGYFFESFREEYFEKLKISLRFVQDNQSLSQKNVIRGMHLQLPPFEQGKLVRVDKGAVFDVAVDLRKNSNSFGKWFGKELSAENKLQMWIPPGFAHGFLSLMDDTIFSYMCTNYYNAEAERSIRWDDPDLNIKWGIDNPILSEKDSKIPSFKEFLKEI